jgi:hypothetical protein
MEIARNKHWQMLQIGLLLICCLPVAGCAGPFAIVALIALAVGLVFSVIAIGLSIGLIPGTIYWIGLAAVIFANNVLSESSNIAKVAFARATLTMIVVILGIVFVHLFEIPEPLHLLYWGAFVFLFTLVLQLGDLFVSGEQQGLLDNLKEIPETQLPKKINEALNDEIQQLRVNQWFTYGLLLIAPLPVWVAMRADWITEARVLELSIAIGAFFMSIAIFAVLIRSAIRLSAPIQSSSGLDLNWEQFKTLYALSHDVRSIRVSEGVHDLVLATGYLIACGAAAQGLSRTASVDYFVVLCVFVMVALLLSVVLLFLPFFIGRRALVTDGKKRMIQKGTAYTEWEPLEKELIKLRSPVPKIAMWRFMVPAFTASGLLTVVATRALDAYLAK